MPLMRSKKDGLQESRLKRSKIEHLDLLSEAQAVEQGAGAQATGAGAQATGAGAQATGAGAQGAAQL